MFTGLIEEIGRIRSVRKQGQAMVMAIEAPRILKDAKLGDSIAVNGVCLTITHFHGSHFTVDVMPETYRHTALKYLSSGSKVNLERAMALNGRFGGHLVQGHVDTPGKIVARQPEENAVVFSIEPEDKAIFKFVIPRGSITLDGISLTVVRVEGQCFSVSIIPHTLAQTTLADKQPGDWINIEADLLGKYVDRLLAYRFAQEPEADSSGKAERKENGKITEQFLADHGFR